MTKGVSFFLCGWLLVSCTFPEQEVKVFSITYNFNIEDQGWTGDFADYPEGDSITYQLFFKHDTLPTNLNANATKKALHISGKNYSDDLFMFIKRKVAGLKANTTYEVLFNIKMASDAKVGVEGAPGESVFLKIGATSFEPLKVLQDGKYRMNLNKGNQAEDGADMITIGHIGVTSTTTQFTSITRYNTSNTSFMASTNSEGELWLIVGTDSGFEGTTTLYYTQIDVLFNQSE